MDKVRSSSYPGQYLFIHFFVLVFFSSECQFKYLEEPIPFLYCNPFISGSTWRTKCRLEIPQEYMYRMKVAWFFQISGEVIRLESLLPTAKIKTTHFSGIIRDSVLTVPVLNISLHTGAIFCGIELDGNPSLFISSTAMVTPRSLSSHLEACPNKKYSQKVNTCAGMMN